MRTFKLWFLGCVVATGSIGCGDGDTKSDVSAVGRPVGLDALVVITKEAPGENCPSGGAKLEYGLDDDASGTLESEEIESTEYACNGRDGADGTNGTNGTAGRSGVSALITTNAVAAGANCPSGGQRIDQGLDANANGTLDASEVAATSYVCNGKSGTDGINGMSTLVAVVEEAPGAQCEAGGIALQHGIDGDSDGTLSASEIAGTNYVCDGISGLSGLDGLVNISSEAVGANCAAGGVRVDFGLDEDSDGALGAAEIDGTRYVCNGAQGADGATSLVNITAEAAGTCCRPSTCATARTVRTAWMAKTASTHASSSRTSRPVRPAQRAGSASK